MSLLNLGGAAPYPPLVNGVPHGIPYRISPFGHVPNAQVPNHGGRLSPSRPAAGLTRYTGSTSVPAAPIPHPIAVRAPGSSTPSRPVRAQVSRQGSHSAASESPPVATLPAPRAVSSGTPLLAHVSASTIFHDGAAAGVTTDALSFSTKALSAGQESALQAEIESLRRALSFQEAEAEPLRRTISMQEDRIAQLMLELQEAHETERRLCAEAESLRTQLAKAVEDKRPATANSRTSGSTPIMGRSSSTRRGASTSPSPSGGRRDSSAHRRVRERPMTVTNSFRRDTQSSKQSLGVAQRTGAAPSVSPNGHLGKDEIDNRLLEFMDSSDCSLLFRRLNRGWYGFRRPDEKGPWSSSRTVELSIVNGKLMAKLEPSTHDEGWNNGKLGPIERFVASMTAMGV